MEQVVSPIQVGYPVHAGSDTQAHALNHENFLSLSTPDNLQGLVEQGKVFQLSIQPEVDQLTQLHSEGHDGYLTVTLPMVGITDYLSPEGGQNASQAFGSVLGLNHFTADSDQPHFSRPDFIMAKDIVGNQYEILVGPDGKIAIPEEGTGKFSLLSEVKLMYGIDQVLEGRGLTAASPDSLLDSSGKLFLLPPVGFHGKYAPEISVSQTQDDFSEKELSSRKVPLLLEDSHNPMISEASLHQISKFLFTEYDFTKAMLSGDEFGVQHTNGLNDFSLSPEAIGVYYDLWLNGVATHQISPDELLNRVNIDEISDLQVLNDLGLSGIDHVDLHALFNQAKAGDLSGLHKLYEPDSGHVHDSVGTSLTEPVTAEVQHHHSDSSLGKVVALSINDVFSPEHHGATISGFDVNKDKLDVSVLLEKMPTIHLQDLSADLHGNDVKIHYQDPATGQMHTFATLVNAAPSNHLPDLLHYLNLNND